jgi:hypothetical protein
MLGEQFVPKISPKDQSVELLNNRETDLSGDWDGGNTDGWTTEKLIGAPAV